MNGICSIYLSVKRTMYGVNSGVFNAMTDEE
ncbi:hypothetical protein T06_14951 [Trichinella sp. T6]|nr:hypothetical protein T06_14951 [Trichinella sp. T6]